MALVYQADIRPTKLELLSAWLPTQAWSARLGGGDLVRVAACRFDDPAGEVGIETMLVRAGDGPVLHTPLTYRGAPLAGAERFLLGTTEHSVLGTRWVYDACGDPVYAAVLARTIATGGGEAEEYVQTDGQPVRRAPIMTVRGSGTAAADPPGIGDVVRVDDGDPTVIVTGSGSLTVLRRPAVADPAALPAWRSPHLTGTWDGQTSVLALLG